MSGQFGIWIAASFTFSVSLTWLAMLVAPALGFVDSPDGGRKRHRKPTPLMGGVAIYVGMATFTLLGAFRGDTWCPDLTNERVASFVLSAGLFCLLGLADDRWALAPRTKFYLQLLAAVPFSFCCSPITHLELFNVQLPLGWLAFSFITIWLTSCSNIVNLSDGMDGLAGSISGIAMIGIGITAALTGRESVAAISWIAGAALAGFLVFNWPPAKIFMGDAGSLTLGFVVGAFALRGYSSDGSFHLLPAMALLGVPVFDTAVAIVRRRLTGKSIGQADRQHFHHCLQDQGYSRVAALVTIIVCSVVLAMGSVIAFISGKDSLAIAAAAAVVASLLLTQTFGHYEFGLVVARLQSSLGRGEANNQPLVEEPVVLQLGEQEAAASAAGEDHDDGKRAA